MREWEPNRYWGRELGMACRVEVLAKWFHLIPRRTRGEFPDYEFCTGCFACQLACCQEHGWEAGLSGINVIEVVQNMPKDKAYLTFLPFPTELCVLCKNGTKNGLEPACVKHCMANCMTYGKLTELAGELTKKPRMVLWSPR